MEQTDSIQPDAQPKDVMIPEKIDAAIARIRAIRRSLKDCSKNAVVRICQEDLSLRNEAEDIFQRLPPAAQNAVCRDPEDLYEAVAGVFWPPFGSICDKVRKQTYEESNIQNPQRQIVENQP